MRNNTTSGETKVVNIKLEDLLVADYQRDIEFDKVRTMVANFNDSIPMTLLVSYRNGKYYIIDGNHRKTALRLLRRKSVDCNVLYGLTKPEEAELYEIINFKTARQKAKDRINSIVVQGNKDYVGFVNAANEAGYTLGLNAKIDKGKGNKKYIHVNAPVTAKRVHATMTNEKFKDLLIVFKEAWGNDKSATSAAMLTAMGLVIKLYDEINLKDMSRKLSAYNPVALERTARFNSSKVESTVTTLAKIIVRKYNENRRSEKNRLNINVIDDCVCNKAM